MTKHRSRRSFRGAAERLSRVERYADRATKLAAVAAALANPERNAWSNYWKIRLLDLMATGTGVRLIPGQLVHVTAEPRREWLSDHLFTLVDDLVVRARLEDGPVGDALRFIRDRELAELAADQGDEHRATSSLGRLNEAVANVRDADDDWISAQRRVIHFAAVSRNDVPIFAYTSVPAVARCGLLPTSEGSEVAGLRESMLLERIEALEAKIPLLDSAPMEDQAAVVHQIWALQKLQAPLPTDARLLADATIQEFRFRWHAGWARQRDDGDGGMNWQYLNCALTSLGRQERVRRFKEWRKGRLVAASAHPKPRSSDVRVLDPGNWVVVEQNGRLKWDDRSKTYKWLPAIAPIVRNAPPIGIIPSRAPQSC